MTTREEMAVRTQAARERRRMESALSELVTVTLPVDLAQRLWQRAVAHEASMETAMRILMAAVHEPGLAWQLGLNKIREPVPPKPRGKVVLKVRYTVLEMRAWMRGMDRMKMSLTDLMRWNTREYTLPVVDASSQPAPAAIDT